MVIPEKSKEELLDEMNGLVIDILSLGDREPDEQMSKSVMEIIGWGHNQSYARILDNSIRVIYYTSQQGQVTPAQLIQNLRIDIRYLGALGPSRNGILTPVRSYSGGYTNCPHVLAGKELVERYVNLARNLREQLRVYRVQGVLNES